MQDRKKIIYLDQYFVSNLAKSVNLENWKDPLADFYRERYYLLVDLTNCDKLICPTSYLHKEESELGNRVKEFLWHFIDELGYGLSFKSDVEIMKSQIYNAAIVYANLPIEKQSDSTVVFNRDPQIPVGRLTRPKISVYFPNSEEFNKYIRLSRASLSEEYWNYKIYCKGKRETYLELK